MLRRMKAAHRSALWARRRTGWKCSFWTQRRAARALVPVCCALEQYGVSELTVNEQNPAAAGFYRHMGFAVYRRSELDEQGGPYPILYMRRG